MDRVRQLQEIVQRENWVILDTETTGLKNAEIVEIAIIDNLGNPLLNTFVHPVMPIPLQATLIHGITDEMCATAPSWSDVGDWVLNAMAGKDVLVYNAKFDRHMLYSSDEHNLIERAKWRDIATWHCVMETFAEYYGDFNTKYDSFTWKPLSVAAHESGFEGTQKHGALSDCLMTLAVVNFLAKVETSR